MVRTPKPVAEDVKEAEEVEEVEEGGGDDNSQMPGCVRRLYARSNCGSAEVGIKPTKNGEKVPGTEREADTGDIFADDFQGVEADHFPTNVEQRAAGVSGIDLRIGLNPSSGPCRGIAANGADNPLGNAEQHGIARIPNCENGFARMDESGVGEREMREDKSGRRSHPFARAMSRSGSI